MATKSRISAPLIPLKCSREMCKRFSEQSYSKWKALFNLILARGNHTENSILCLSEDPIKWMLYLIQLNLHKKMLLAELCLWRLWCWWWRYQYDCVTYTDDGIRLLLSLRSLPFLSYVKFIIYYYLDPGDLVTQYSQVIQVFIVLVLINNNLVLKLSKTDEARAGHVRRQSPIQEIYSVSADIDLVCS